MASLGLLSSLVRKALTLSWLLSNPSLNPNSKFEKSKMPIPSARAKRTTCPNSYNQFFFFFFKTTACPHKCRYTRKTVTWLHTHVGLNNICRKGLSQVELLLSHRLISIYHRVPFPSWLLRQRFLCFLMMSSWQGHCCNLLSPHNVCYKYCTFALCNKDTLVYQKNLSSTDFIVRLYFFFQLL